MCHTKYSAEFTKGRKSVEDNNGNKTRAKNTGAINPIILTITLANGINAPIKRPWLLEWIRKKTQSYVVNKKSILNIKKKM